MEVSVVVPCFNHAATLERAIASALRQTDIREVITVDDASTDQSAEVARNLVECNAQVHLSGQEINTGPGAARNHGAARATGRFICFLEADDELMGDFIGAALQLFQQNPGLIVAKCEMEFFDPVKGYILPMHDPRHQSAILSSSCGMLMRHDHFLQMGGFPEDPVFRGPMGGEDVASMQAVMAHFQPIARIEQAGYRVWSQSGSHVDRFLASTRIAGGGFEFVTSRLDHADEDSLDKGIQSYMESVARNLRLTVDARILL